MSSEIKQESTVKKEENEPEIKYFHCYNCQLKEKYEYFGSNPPFFKKYLLLEDAFVIEDPFLPPKQGEILILGAHCIKCRNSVCKDTNCSMYYEGTYCIKCAKLNIKSFPLSVQEKLNRIIS